MSKKLNNLHVLNSQSKLAKHKETAQKTELLELFSTYVYLANPDYKYNETYLKDMISGFWENIEKYSVIVSFRNELVSVLKKIEIKSSFKCKLTITIDELWELHYDNISEKGESKWVNLVSENPRLNLIDSEYVYVKYNFDGENHKFTHYLEMKDHNEIKSLTKKYIESFLMRLGGEISNDR